MKEYLLCRGKIDNYEVLYKWLPSLSIALQILWQQDNKTELFVKEVAE